MKDSNLNSSSAVARSILVARGLPVMLDADLAALYGVSTIALWKLRPPGSTQRHRDPRSPPFVFTEHGATMLAMVLQSPRAIDMSVHVVRAFTALRDAARTNAALQEQLTQLEKRVGKHDAD